MPLLNGPHPDGIRPAPSASQNRGKVLSRQHLMDTIWVGVVVTDRTVDVNMTRLRKKLGSYAQNVVSRTGFGYVFEE